MLEKLLSITWIFHLLMVRLLIMMDVHFNIKYLNINNLDLGTEMEMKII